MRFPFSNVAELCLTTFFALVLALGAAFASEQDGENDAKAEDIPRIAFAARIAGDENRTRLVTDFDREITFNVQLLDNPYRAVIDLPETEFNFSKETDEASRGLVKNIRYGTIAPGKSRIVLLLNGPVRVDASETKQIPEEKRFRLLVDLVSAPQDEFATEVKRQEAERKAALAASVEETPQSARGATASGPKSKNKFTIVIDPGHGGIDGGAVGIHRSVEKRIVFAFSQKLAKAISDTGKFNVILTRDKDVFVSLRQRVKIARDNEADLMISVHADSLPQSFIRGATVYTLSDKASDRLSEQLAHSENLSDVMAGLSVPSAENEVRDILVDLTMRETKTFSLAAAQIFVDKLGRSLKLIKNPIRSASFQVLRAPEVPSILLELGYLSNEEDEKMMMDAQWQKDTAKLVSDAVLNFFEPRLAARGQ